MTDTRLNTRGLLWRITTVGLVGYVGWVVWSEHRVRAMARAELERHATVVMPALWHWEPGMCRDYLDLAVRAHGYAGVRVLDESGEVFLFHAGPSLVGVDRWFHRLGLLPMERLVIPVRRAGEVLGRLEADWYVRTIYSQIWVLLGLVVGWGLLERHLRVLETRDTLQMRVAERTRELAEANAALRASEARYRSFVEQGPDLFCRFAADGVLTYVNPAYGRFFGRRAEELVGQSLYSLISEADREAVEASLRRGLRPDMPPLLLEHRVVAADGSLRWLRWTNSAVRDETGRFLEYQAIGQDITEQKRAQVELARNHELYRRAIMAAAAVPYELELPGRRYRFVGEGIRDLTGLEARELTPEKLAAVVEETVLLSECSGLTVAEAQERLERGELEHWRADYRVRMPMGEIRWLSDAAVPVRDERGHVRGLLGILQDVTERRRMAEEHARLATAVEQADELIWMTDPQGRIVYVNPAVERVSGYTRNELLGQTPRLFKSGRHAPEFYEGLWSTLTRGLPWKGRITNRGKDGRLFELELSISPVRDAVGQIVHFVAVGRDITRQVALEERLREAQKLEAIGRLAAGVAHEFNNLLTVIQGNALLIDSARLSAEDAHCVGQIVHAAQRAAEVTRSLLMYSRRQPLQMQAVDLNDLVQRTARMLTRVLGEQVTLRLDLQPEVPTLRADAGLVEQLILNLALNARDAMPHGGELVLGTHLHEVAEETARERPEVRPGTSLCLTVRDTGVGIPPEDLPHIFEPFFTTKEVGKGTGLGLASVYGIVQQHGGWIEVESEPGRGTVFRIHFPLVERGRPDTAGRQAQVGLPESGPGILVVEDEEALARLTGNLLRRWGYRVWTATGAPEALALWQAHAAEIDLLLTDVVLPGSISGFELEGRLRQEKPGLRVLYTSGYYEVDLGQAPFLIEGENFLPKPYRPQQLLEMLRRLLDRGQGQPETEVPG